MKHQTLLFIPALGLSVISPAAFSQENELDITIRVMNENEQPSEFVQRLELPPPENFDLSAQDEPSVTITLEEEIDSASEDITSTANASEEITVNTIIDNISIDGAVAQESVDNAGNLPGQIVNILDDELPLNDDLTDTVDDATGEIVDVTDGLGDLAGGITGDPGDTGNDIVDNVEDTTGGVTDAVDDATGDITGDVGDSTDDISGDVTDTVDDTTGDIPDGIGDSTDDVSGDVAGTVDDAVNDSVGDIGESADGVEQSLDAAGDTGDLTSDLESFSQPLEEDPAGLAGDLTEDL